MTPMIRNALHLLSLIGLSICTGQAMADGVKCSGYYNHRLPWATSTISFGKVYVDPTAKIGAVIAEIVDPSLDSVGDLLDCDGLTSGELAWNAGDFPQTDYPAAGDMSSGIDGVAIRLKTTGHYFDWPSGRFPREVWGLKGCRQSSDWIHFFCGRMWGTLTVQLIKAASRTGTGTTGARHLAAAAFVRRVPHAYDFTLAGLEVHSSGCEVRTPQVNVSMGRVSSREMRGIGGTSQPQVFGIGLDCMADTRVRLKLDDAGSSANSIPGVLSLSDGPNRANGVGIQILFNGQPVPLGQYLEVGQQKTAGSFDVALQARYYQTAEHVDPGTANAQAFFSLEYR